MKKFQTILFLSILIILIPMYVYGVNIEFNIYADSQKYNVDIRDLFQGYEQFMKEKDEKN